jgi:hypothetical protein
VTTDLHDAITATAESARQLGTIAQSARRRVVELEAELEDARQEIGRLRALAERPLPVVQFRRPHDEILDLLIDGVEVASANHDDHGWSGMAAFEKLAVTLVKAFGGDEIGEVEFVDDEADDER